MITAGEERGSFNHLGQNAPSTPHVDLNVVLLPCEHSLRGAVESRRDITSHFAVHRPGETEVADFEITIIINQNITGLEIPVHHACGMNVLQSTLDRGSISYRSLGSTFAEWGTLREPIASNQTGWDGP